ncbi:class I SAM-dependent methyltransferase [Zemynaea arenosa]|nr:class I SAM-dependent methyltransferase [Massilia arenosa]
MSSSDTAFAGSIPELYERYLVPLIFAPYATDLAARARRHQPSDVLEIAAGTGAVTRRLVDDLPPSTRIVSTDLNQAMLDVASRRGTARPVTWQRADAMALPFADASFDLVVCQFGAMFFPDRPKAYAEVRRVLRPGGRFLFNVWDTLDENDFPRVVLEALRQQFAAQPPTFMQRIPHGYADPDVIRRDLIAGGFRHSPEIVSVGAPSYADSAQLVAIAFCQATPMRAEIEALGSEALDTATRVAEDALIEEFGAGPVTGRIRAHVIEVRL